MVAAQTKVAKRSGLTARRPEGKDIFWQKVYAPVYYRLPMSLRNKVVAAMPGSHRQTWHDPAQAAGPAASVTRSWSLPAADATPDPAATPTTS